MIQVDSHSAKKDQPYLLPFVGVKDLSNNAREDEMQEIM
jgi:hypothetical protein